MQKKKKTYMHHCHALRGHNFFNPGNLLHVFRAVAAPRCRTDQQNELPELSTAERTDWLN